MTKNDNNFIRLDYLKQALFSFVDLLYVKVNTGDTFPTEVTRPDIDIALIDFHDFIKDNYPQEWRIRQALLWTLNLNKANWKKVYLYLEVPWPQNNEASVRLFLESLWDYTFRSWKYRGVAGGLFREENQKEWMETLAGESVKYLHDLNDIVIIPISLEDIPLQKLAQCLNELTKCLNRKQPSGGPEIKYTVASSFMIWIEENHREVGSVYRALRWMLNQNDHVFSIVCERLNLDASPLKASFSRQTFQSFWVSAFENWKKN